jgi:hypothetical protein
MRDPAPADDKRLDRQQAYQHFHIGIYISLFTAIIGASFLRKADLPELHALRFVLVAAIALLGLAGICGGTVASKIPSATDHSTFYKERIGFSFPWSSGFWPRFKTSTWESLEHLFFWIAMGLLFWVGAALIFGPDRPSPRTTHSAEAVASAAPSPALATKRMETP